MPCSACITRRHPRRRDGRGLQQQSQHADPSSRVPHDHHRGQFYLWRAAITRCHSPRSGGFEWRVIVTDWYVHPNSPGERVKLTVSILDQDLRADALRVAASRQVNQNGEWVNAPVSAATVQKLEDIILTRARDLRRTAVAG